jgi:Cytochrome c554 and c-prime
VKAVVLIAVALSLAASGQHSRLQLRPQSPTARSVIPETGFNSKAGYAGDDACRSCHQDKVQAFHQTAHYFTSRLPDKDSILGNFSTGANVMTTSNAELFFKMEEKDGAFFQTAVEGTAPYVTSRTERFAFVIGSGGKGQTYLYWKGDQLFQLPVSYWKELGWVNSPGYRDGRANFDRPVVPRCLECHGTYFEALPPPPNRYRQSGFIVGIRCEKCHGPGGEHVRRYQSKSARPADTAILNPARFPRDRQMDLCGWCHAGLGTAVAPTFSYVPGNPLESYIKMPQPDPGAPLDVHGSQVELLKRSGCYRRSGMTCLTCHNVHLAQHDPAEFSQRCLSCHKPESAMFPRHGSKVGSNCIDCHMPLQETNLIVFDQNGRKAKPRVRNHWVRVYSETTASQGTNHQPE